MPREVPHAGPRLSAARRRHEFVHPSERPGEPGLRPCLWRLQATSPSRLVPSRPAATYTSAYYTARRSHHIGVGSTASSTCPDQRGRDRRGSAAGATATTTTRPLCRPGPSAARSLRRTWEDDGGAFPGRGPECRRAGRRSRPPRRRLVGGRAQQPLEWARPSPECANNWACSGPERERGAHRLARQA